MRHANSIQLISALNVDFLSHAEDAAFSSIRRQPVGRKIISYYYEYSMRHYFSVIVDVMNVIWSRSPDSFRGSTMYTVTVWKMTQILSPCLGRRRGEALKQIHLHVDDPKNNIKQKFGEREWRDSARDVSEGVKLSGEEELHKMSFLLPITARWGILMQYRVSRDAIPLFHLFCGAVAGIELANEHN